MSTFRVAVTTLSIEKKVLKQILKIVIVVHIFFGKKENSKIPKIKSPCFFWGWLFVLVFPPPKPWRLSRICVGPLPVIAMRSERRRILPSNLRTPEMGHGEFSVKGWGGEQGGMPTNLPPQDGQGLASEDAKVFRGWDFEWKASLLNGRQY